MDNTKVVCHSHGYSDWGIICSHIMNDSKPINDIFTDTLLCEDCDLETLPVELANIVCMKCLKKIRKRNKTKFINYK